MRAAALRGVGAGRRAVLRVPARTAASRAGNLRGAGGGLRSARHLGSGPAGRSAAAADPRRGRRGRERAIHTYQQLVAHRPWETSDHMGTIASLTMLAACAARFEDAETARGIFPILEPHAGEYAVIAGVAGVLAPLTLTLGELCGTLGRYDQAVRTSSAPSRSAAAPGCAATRCARSSPGRASWRGAMRPATAAGRPPSAARRSAAPRSSTRRCWWRTPPRSTPRCPSRRGAELLAGLAADARPSRSPPVAARRGSARRAAEASAAAAAGSDRWTERGFAFGGNAALEGAAPAASARRRVLRCAGAAGAAPSARLAERMLIAAESRLLKQRERVSTAAGDHFPAHCERRRGESA